MNFYLSSEYISCYIFSICILYLMIQKIELFSWCSCHFFCKLRCGSPFGSSATLGTSCRIASTLLPSIGACHSFTPNTGRMICALIFLPQVKCFFREFIRPSVRPHAAASMKCMLLTYFWFYIGHWLNWLYQISWLINGALHGFPFEFSFFIPFFHTFAGSWRLPKAWAQNFDIDRLVTFDAGFWMAKRWQKALSSKRLPSDSWSFLELSTCQKLELCCLTLHFTHLYF